MFDSRFIVGIGDHSDFPIFLCRVVHVYDKLTFIGYLMPNPAFIYIYIFFFLIIQYVKARVIPCPHQPPTRAITFSVAQSGTATPDNTKQLLPLDRVDGWRYIYIYTHTHQIN